MATPRFFPDMGGVESHVYEVSRRLAAAGHDVAILTTGSDVHEPERGEVEGVEVLRVPALPRKKDYRFVKGIGRHLDSLEPDLLHVQSYHTFVAPQAMTWAAWRAVPYVLTFHAGGHSSGLRNAIRPIQQWTLRPLLAASRRLVVLSEWEADMYARRLRLPRHLFATIANGADLPALTNPPATDPDLVVSVGRLERYKGHHRVIAALPHLVSTRPGVRLWIAGHGPYEDHLRRLADELGVGDRVTISAVPPGERDRMAREVARAGVVALLSDYETQPIAALEALALKRRLVVADSPGLRKLAEGTWARTVAAEAHPQTVARVLDEEMSAPSPEGAVSPPTWDECARSLDRLYEDVLG